MSDIAKCHGKVYGQVCKKRDECERYTMPSDPDIQWYMQPAEMPCKNFIGVKNDRA